MFETLAPEPEDQIMALGALFRADPRQGRIDLGIGVYRDAAGRTPVMAAVREAERRIWEGETTKSYTALAGDAAFNDAIVDLVLGEGLARSGRVSVAATPGGTGAIRQAADLIARARPGATVWLPDPTWPNHPAVLAPAGLRVAPYRYYDAATGGVDLGGMLADLGQAGPGDVIVLHGACHNPTGADLAPEGWAAVADLCAAQGAVPLIDLAYMGFGAGLGADAAGTRTLAQALPEVLVAVSCSKNFGIYRERTGALIALTPEGARRAAMQGTLTALNRTAYSFPPDHGARIVATILADPGLRALWEGELDAIRTGMIANRAALAAELVRLGGGARFDRIAHQRGMFSLLPVAPGAVARLRADHAIYLVGNGRMNVAGLTPANVPAVARAIIAAMAEGEGG
jgi:aspartate/tyrosine/aromatic aminotransferase